jgi:hypothetical protein
MGSSRLPALQVSSRVQEWYAARPMNASRCLLNLGIRNSECAGDFAKQITPIRSIQLASPKHFIHLRFRWTRFTPNFPNWKLPGPAILSFRLAGSSTKCIGKHWGVSEDLSPCRAELAVASGSQLPDCPSTAHNRNLGRRALLRLALNPSKWFRCCACFRCGSGLTLSEPNVS